MEKTCKTCHATKPTSEFYAARDTKDRLQTFCKECAKAKQIEYRNKNLEATRARSRDYQRAHKEEAKARIIEWLYGLSYDRYLEMLEEQEERCKICKRKGSGDKRTSRLAIDHDHKTGEVRGLLCQPCNRGIGLLQDSPDILASAIAYLTKKEA